MFYVCSLQFCLWSKSLQITHLLLPRYIYQSKALHGSYCHPRLVILRLSLQFAVVLMSVGNKNILQLDNFSGVLLAPYFVRIHPFALKLTAETLSYTVVRRLHMHKCMQLRCVQSHRK
jgi:hypothetical protein